MLASAPAALAAPDPPTSVAAAASPTNTRPSLSWVAPAGTTGSVTYDVWRNGTKLDGVSDLGADVHRHLLHARAGVVVVHGDHERRDRHERAVVGGERRLRHGRAARADGTHRRHTDEPEARRSAGCRAVTTRPPASSTTRSTAGRRSWDRRRARRSPTRALVTSGSQTYTVKAVDAAGNVSAASVAKAVMFDTVIPSAPVLSAPAATNTSTTLTWTASTDLGGSTLTSYAVYRNGVLIGAPTPATALTYTDTGAMSPGTYTYTVYALDGAGNSSLASNAKAVVLRRDATRRADRSRRDDADEPEADPALDRCDGHRRIRHRPLRRLSRGDARGLDRRHELHRRGADAEQHQRLRDPRRRRRRKRRSGELPRDRRVRRDRAHDPGIAHRHDTDELAARALVGRVDGCAERRRPLRRLPGQHEDQQLARHGPRVHRHLPDHREPDLLGARRSMRPGTRRPRRPPRSSCTTRPRRPRRR